jgi:hypothetical protein
VYARYWTKVMTSLMSEAQRPGVQIIEMLAINGGHVSQLERRTMPAIIANAVTDLRAKGVSISVAGSEEETDIKVLLRSCDIADFYARLERDMMFGVQARKSIVKIGYVATHCVMLYLATSDSLP